MGTPSSVALTRADIDAVTFDVDGTFYNLKRMRRRAALLMLRHLDLLRAYVRARETVRRQSGLARRDEPHHLLALARRCHR